MTIDVDDGGWMTLHCDLCSWFKGVTEALGDLDYIWGISQEHMRSAHGEITP